jgi:hypothetical protein
VALEREVQAWNNDIASTTSTVNSLASLASGLTAARTTLAGLGTTFTTTSNQLAALQATVTDDTSAATAVTQATGIWNMAAQSANVPEMVAANQTWNSLAPILAARVAAFGTQQALKFNTQTGAWPPTADSLGDKLSAFENRVLDTASRIPALLGPALVPPVRPGGAPAGAYAQMVTPWLVDRTNALRNLATQVNQTASWLAMNSDANLANLASIAQANAQAFSSRANRVAAACTSGGTPATAMALAGVLTDLSALRTNAWSTPVLTAQDQTFYRARMQELTQALGTLLTSPTGVAAGPTALLPVRLETRLFPGAVSGTELRVRVFVDDIHIDSHDTRLTDDERTWATQLQSAISQGGDAAHTTWSLACRRFGATRTAYLLGVPLNTPGKTSTWAQPAVARCLPDSWLAVAVGADGSVLGATVGKPIPTPLQVGPDPTVSLPAPSPTSPAPSVPVNAGLQWLVDFGKAEDAGMALRIQLDFGATPGSVNPSTVSIARVFVVGLHAGDSTSAVSQLLQAHRYTDGLELVAFGTPTNNTETASAGYSSDDPNDARSYHFEVELGRTPYAPAPIPSDADYLTSALGLPLGALAAAGDSRQTQSIQQALVSTCWDATFGGFLTEIGGMSTTRADQVRAWATAWLRPLGPLPTLRVGRQPYGLLPTLALRSWNETQRTVATDIYGVLSRALPTWIAAFASAYGAADLNAVLERRPLSAEIAARFAGIMPGWLVPGDGIQGLTPETIANRIAQIPSWNATLQSALGLSGPVVNRTGLLVVPDWVPQPPGSPWPLVGPSGSIQAAPANIQPQADPFLAALIARQSTPRPDNLVSALAGYGWTRTGAATSTAAFAARPLFGASSSAVTPSPADSVGAAVRYIAARNGADLADGLGSTLDAAAHRLDAWITALATQRLAQQRSSAPAGLVVGGFGWVENLHGRGALAPANPPVANEPLATVDSANAGYVQAPSLQQATTAAVLRSGFLTHNPRNAPVTPDAPFAVDLSSRRARLAIWILDGVRQGQPLAALLGYRFERTLQENGRPDLIEFMRQAFPYDAAVGPDGLSASAAEQVRATDVVDGVSLIEAYQAGRLNGSPWTIAEVAGALANLDDAADAVADALLAQGVHDTLTGNLASAAATLESVATGGVPAPRPRFLDTPRTGVPVHHRVLVPVDVAATMPPAGWPTSPRGQAEPGLDDWAGRLLGDPRTVAAAVMLLDASGNTVGSSTGVSITLDQLGLGPLDVLSLVDRPSEIERLAVYRVLATQPQFASQASDGHLLDAPNGAVRPLRDLLELARTLQRVVSAARGADARDVCVPGTELDARADLTNLAQRVQMANQALATVTTSLQTAIAGVVDPPTDDQAQTLAAALVRAIGVGVAGCAPVGIGADCVPQLEAQADAAQSDLQRRSALIARQEPSATDTSATILQGRVRQLATAFGGGFTALPHFATNPVDVLARATGLTQVTTTDPGQSPDAWLARIAHVMGPVGDLVEAYCGAEALSGTPMLNLTIGQLPLPTPPPGQTTPLPQPWVGLPFASTASGPALPVPNTVAITALGTSAPAGTIAALLVADWTEVLPSPRETTGVAYHFDAPGAQAPQSILLAVPANAAATVWTYNDLLDTLLTTLDLTHARAIDCADLPLVARAALPAVYLDNLADGTPPVPVVVPPDYLNQYPMEQTISGVEPVTIRQGAIGVLRVHGTNFRNVPLAGISIGGGEVAISQPTPLPANPDTDLVLNISVQGEAHVGARSVQVGSAQWQPTAQSPGLTIAWRARADTCDTSNLAQSMADQTITVGVHGHWLQGAQANISRSLDVGVTSATVAAGSVTSDGDGTILNVAVFIAASSYDPSDIDYEPPVQLPNEPYQKPRGPISRKPFYRNVPLVLSVTPVEQAATSTFNLMFTAME